MESQTWQSVYKTIYSSLNIWSVSCRQVVQCCCFYLLSSLMWWNMNISIPTFPPFPPSPHQSPVVDTWDLDSVFFSNTVSFSSSNQMLLIFMWNINSSVEGVVDIAMGNSQSSAVTSVLSDKCVQQERCSNRLNWGSGSVWRDDGRRGIDWGVLSNLSDLDVVVLSQSDLLYQSDS